MKITIYELLGLIKDGKAPMFIKYADDIYAYVYKDTIQGSYDYKDEYGSYLFIELFKNKYLSDVLKVEIEILDEEDEFIDIKELNLDTDELLKKVIITAQDYVIEGKINEIIKNQKKIIQALKENK